ncbi:serine/threonine-protein kinase [Xylaria palmicola]|nr:serine/threonine-protein kinase [Xylaria palmicola]
MAPIKTVKDLPVARPCNESQLGKHACLDRTRPSPTNTTTSPEVEPEDVSNSAVQPRPVDMALHIGMFEIGKPLGKGQFGRVYLAKHRQSGHICALKMLRKEEIAQAKVETHVRREIEVHSNLRHPGILTFYGWFHDLHRIFLVLEYAPGGELFKSLKQEGCFSEQRAAWYIAQVTSSLIHLHTKNIMHRDIKPENILVGLHGELKLADFGLSAYTPDDRRTTCCGTPDYLAPEMIPPSRPLSYSKAIDQWALGVLAYEFLTGSVPFESSVIADPSRIMKPLPNYLSWDARDFVYSLLMTDPSKRLPLKDVFDHPWIVKNCR